MFKIVGISTLKGKTKVRFANDMVSRIKILNKEGHQDIFLQELPTEMTKLDAIRHLKTLEVYEKFADVIDAAESKYVALGTVKVQGPSLEAIKARAGIVDTETSEDTVKTESFSPMDTH
jgi:hypothetical protein